MEVNDGYVAGRYEDMPAKDFVDMLISRFGSLQRGAKSSSSNNDSGTARSAIEFFTSDEYTELVKMIKNWKELGQPSSIKLSDFIRQFDAPYRDKIAGILFDLWPYLYQVIETLKQNQRQNQ